MTYTEQNHLFEPQVEDLSGAGWNRLVEWMRQQRADAPVRVHRGVFHVFRAESARRVLTESAAFSSDRTSLMPATDQLGRGNLTMMDPPDHSRMRRIVNQAFTPAAVGALSTSIEKLATELVRGLNPEGFDAVSALAYPLPILVISRMLGLPESAVDRFQLWSIAFSQGDTLAMDEMHQFLVAVARAKRKLPADDVMSRLVTAAVDGTLASDDEVASLAGLILLAGHVTTTSLIAASLFELTERPALAAVLDNGRLDDLVEETLRVRPAFAQVTRIAIGKQRIDGVDVPDGAVVAAWIISANHDAALNPEPEEFRLDRPGRRHLSFGHGVHYCLGSPLARLESRILIQVLHHRFPVLRRIADVSFHPQPTLSVRRLMLSAKGL